MAAQARAALTGLELRPLAGEAQVADMVRVENAELAADGVPERIPLDERLNDFRHPTEHFDLRRDVTLAWLDSVVVGVGQREWVDTTDGRYREYRVGGAVEPGHRRLGIGRALLRYNEARQRQLAALHDTSRQRVLGAWTGDTQPGAVALLESEGYQPVRWFFDMRRPTLDDIPHVALPDGLEIRPITDELVRAVWDADIEAFQDHWGGFDASDEALQRYKEAPDWDPSLWLVAWDGDEVAGGIINGISKEENEALGVQRGWLHSVFTRRRWRKRGLASALIPRSLLLLRERGMTSAVLGVDADNPTGALGLYERAGFEVEYRSTAWRKPMEGA